MAISTSKLSVILLLILGCSLLRTKAQGKFKSIYLSLSLHQTRSGTSSPLSQFCVINGQSRFPCKLTYTQLQCLIITKRNYVSTQITNVPNKTDYLPNRPYWMEIKKSQQFLFQSIDTGKLNFRIFPYHVSEQYGKRSSAEDQIAIN